MSARQRTYWHLEGLGKKPTDYEVATSRLAYGAGRTPEVQTPMAAWAGRHRATALSCADWERFRDPRETTYAAYTALMRDRELLVDGALAAAASMGSDARLAGEWVALLDGALAPLRYPLHGLEMVACYVGSMAPSGRLAVVCLFQAADEIRRIQRIALRMRQLQLGGHPGFGSGSRAAWERDPRWQPARRLVEQLLVTYDWGEALCALNLVVKPALDELFVSRLGARALAAGDEALHKLLLSLDEDCRWQRAWTAALTRLLEEESADNARVLAAWIDKWRPPTASAVTACGELMGEAHAARA